MENTIKVVKDFAAAAHEGQYRRYSPDPYIIHPVQVMNICKSYTEDTCQLSAALLHDVLEDTAVTSEQLELFLHSVLDRRHADRTLGLVIELTDVYTKAHYPEWNRKKRRSKEAKRLGLVTAAAQTIKYADIMDNCKAIVQNDPDFAPTFLRECGLLLEYMQAGNQELYEEVRMTVKKEQHALNKVKVY